MNILSKEIMATLKSDLPTKVVQFGGGNFLRAFVGWQVEQMNQKQVFNGQIAIIHLLDKETDHAYVEQDYLYTVLLNGILQNEIVNTSEVITNIADVINPYVDFTSFLELAKNDHVRVLTSNSTEAGLVFAENDKPQEGHVASSFPGKLTQFLYERYRLGKKGFIIIPCELVEQNGKVLQAIVLKLVDLWKLGSDFKQWILAENIFCSSLVDRIVPGYPRDREAEIVEHLRYRDQLMVAAEPYYQWVIEAPTWVSEELPLAKAGLNVIFTANIEPYRERKVHILNGAHTALVAPALLAGLETVEQAMHDEDFCLFLERLLSTEIIPSLTLPKADLQTFARAIKERFQNPFIRHEFVSIFLNSISKFKSRLLPVLKKYEATRSELPSYIVFALANLLVAYKILLTKRNDDPVVLQFFDDAWKRKDDAVTYILGNEALWGEDLNVITGLTDLVNDYAIRILTADVRTVLKEILA